jgi:nucleoside phosphorylase
MSGVAMVINTSPSIIRDFPVASAVDAVAAAVAAVAVDAVDAVDAVE